MIAGAELRCAGGLEVVAAPVARLGGVVRALPDASATVRAVPGGIEVAWDDGLRLGLGIASHGGRHVLTASLRTRASVCVDSLGVRLHLAGSSRVLVDGFHSWDWAGLRDATGPGRGWWGCVWGTPGGRALCVGAADVPTVGALGIAWDGRGALDALSVGEPVQESLRTGPPRPLDVVVGPRQVMRADPVRVMSWESASASGVGLPTPRGRRPGARTAGWMSWNCLGPDACAADVLEACENLVPPGGLALLDDGWMPWWGDWWEREDLDSSIADLATEVHARGRRLGVWLAPFLADPRSTTTREHAEVLLRDGDGSPVVDRRPPAPQHVLDGAADAARRRLAEVATRLGSAGVDALKLDFLYAGALPGARAGMSGVGALRAGMEALVSAFRDSAPRGARVYACGAPAAPLVGLVDACRSGGDSVINIPCANAEPPGHPWYAHGMATLRAQERNLAARSWLWGSTVPADVDAVTLGPVGELAAAEAPEAHAWLQLARRAGGPFLIADDPTGATLTLDRREWLERAWAGVAGSPAVAARPRSPLVGEPQPVSEDDFYSWPEEGSFDWDR